MTKSYQDRLREQIEQYRDTENMHDLPAAFHIWSEDYVRPGLKAVFGAEDINTFYVDAFARAAQGGARPTFLSLGCGDGSVEIGIAGALMDRGITSFRFLCYDLSDILLDRFRAALPAALALNFELLAEDLNARTFDAKFDAVMANHSLHHMVDLEGIFGAVHRNLADHGILVTNDMIGRNGHMRWPEAKLFVDFFWPMLTLRQRGNTLLRRLEERFLDHDCAAEGFEGVRAQDVLPLLLAGGFHPERFFGFGGMVDVFVDRCFGPNFDTANQDDVFLIRRIGFLNDVLLDAGLLKPTMMFATFVKQPVTEICYRNRSARASLRDPASAPDWLAGTLGDLTRHPTDPSYVFRGADLT